jgi:hypothetical protein
MAAPLMEEAMRWFGPADTVTLEEIRQTGATAVFTALHEVPYGQVWPMETILQRRAQIEAAGLRWTAVESVPVHESIKTRTDGCAEAIAAYQETLRRLGAAGLQTVIYNFMPVLDWVRTDLHHRLADGAEALLYDPVKFAAFDLFALGRPGADADFPESVREAAARYWADLGTAGQQAFTRQTLDLFPGVKLNVSLDGLRAMLAIFGGPRRLARATRCLGGCAVWPSSAACRSACHAPSRSVEPGGSFPENGRDGEIRTLDLLLPKQALYQAKLRPDFRLTSGQQTPKPKA